MSDVLPDVTKEAKPKPGIWELAWPAILTNLLFSVIGIVSIKVVGSLGAEAGSGSYHRTENFLWPSGHSDGHICGYNSAGCSFMGRW